MTIPQRISFVTLGARDMAAQRAFYRRLGWAEDSGASDHFATFTAGTVRLALYPLEHLGGEAAPGAALLPEGSWNGVTLAVNVESREAVDAAYDKALSAGADAVHEPVDRDWGGYSAYIGDPEGHRWELAWAPGLDLS